MDNSDSDNEPRRLKEMLASLTNSPFDIPIEIIAMKHPELFEEPRYWTDHHAELLHVVFKEDKLPALKPGGFKPHLHRLRKKAGSICHSGSTGKDKEPVIEQERVPPFALPNLSEGRRNFHIGSLRRPHYLNNGGYDSHNFAMNSLLAWRSAYQRSMWNLLNPDYSLSSSSSSSSDSERRGTRVKGYAMQLTLLYGERLFPIAEEPNFYHLVGNMLLKRRMPWSLLYLDRSQLQIPLSVPSSKKKKRRRRPRRSAAARRKALKKAQAQDGEEKKKKTPPTPPNQGVIASMFIAIAQHRLLDISDLDENDEQPEANNAQRPVAQQDVRYQILLTDNAVSSAYIHLYTAQVSDFLLECFKTPTRLPRVAPPSRDSPLMRVHHAAVPYIPRASFQQRLYEAIRKHANGTADGFFSSSGE